MKNLSLYFVLLTFVLSNQAYSACELALVKYANNTESRWLSFSDGETCGETNTTNTQIGPGEEGDYVSGRVNQGYNVARVFTTGSYTAEGGKVVEGIKAIFSGRDRKPDVEGARQRAQLMENLSAALRNLEAKIISDIEKRNEKTEKILIQTQIEFQEWQKDVEGSKQAAIQALLNAQNSSDLSEGILVTSSEAFALSQASLNVTQAKFEELKKGGLTPDATSSLKAGIQAELDNFNKNKKLDQINGLLSLIANEKNEYRKRQLQNILASVLNQDGLVKQWQNQLNVNHSLTSSPNNPFGVKSRGSMNLIMGAMVNSLQNGTATAETLSRSEQNLRIIEGADDRVVDGSPYDQMRAQRHINQGYALAAFLTNSPLSDQLKKTSLNPSAVGQFPSLIGFDKVTSYESYVIVNAVNQFLLGGSAGGNDYVAFYARMFVDKAIAAAGLQNVAGFQAAIDGLQSLTDFKKGFSEGVLLGAVDTVEGLWHLVTSPVESVQSLALAVYHYDRTYDAVKGLILQTAAEMPTWSTEQWGKFGGRIGFEVGSALVGAKIFDTAADLAKLPRLTAGIDAGATAFAKASEEAIGFGLNSADEIFEFSTTAWTLGMTETQEYARLASVIDYSSSALPDAVPADLHLLGAGDQLRPFVDAVVPKEGWFDMIIHGHPQGFGVLHNGNMELLTHRDLATFMKKNGWDGDPVRLMSCKTGMCPDGAAQNLANKLGVEVMAPSHTLWFWADGRLTIGPVAKMNIGEWRLFKPGE